MSSALTNLPLLPLSIALWSSYALTLSIRSIRAARTWEEPSKVAAQYSQMVGNELRKTKVTESVGAVVTILSLATALILAIPAHILPSLTSTNTSYTPLAFAALNALTSYSARTYLQSYWKAKAKVPMMEKYNISVEMANQLARALGWMSLAWGMEGVGRGIEVLGV